MNTYQLDLCKEVVLSVGNLTKVKEFYQNYVGFQLYYEGNIDSSLLSFWNLPKDCEAKECILLYPDTDYGWLRLIQFEGVPQKYIRSGGQVWDTGGIYDIDLRVKAIDAVYAEMQEMGWHGASNPVLQTMGPFVLKEVLVKGHDEVVIALVDRIEPPLPAKISKGFISPVYLSAMIVKDHPKAYHFFVNQLGFRVMNDLKVVNQEEGANMFGLPYNLSTQYPATLSLVAPTESRDSMFDILQFEGLKGADFSENAAPPNRGILMYRFFVKNLENYYQTLISRETPIHTSPQSILVYPYGKVNCMVVRSPDGVWIEFMEIEK